MLTKEDKEFLKEEIKNAVEDALTVELTLEKVRDDFTGQPLARPDIKKEKVFLPSFFVQQIAFHEGAFRGMQEDIGKAQGAMKLSKDGIEAIANLLVSMESGIKTFITAANKMQERIDYIETKMIEE